MQIPNSRYMHRNNTREVNHFIQGLGRVNVIGGKSPNKFIFIITKDNSRGLAAYFHPDPTHSTVHSSPKSTFQLIAIPQISNGSSFLSNNSIQVPVLNS
jgi:hypothetical protein